MDSNDRIRPYTENPTYWQYKGQPVLMVGGSKTDHLFLLDDLEDHLDDIQAAGGNYVRNTMSQREEKARKPHFLRPDGRFDLDVWNDDYWQRFDNMLRWTAERDIIVQIEVWDRFDYSQGFWEHSPWNPGNNVNYTYEVSGFAPHYPLHPATDVHPFFHTIPEMTEYRPHYDLIRAYQERFVSQMLSYSLPHGHVLYCMNNETSTDPRWGQYWIRYIQAAATRAGVTLYTTDMFDDTWRGPDGVHFLVALHNPALYSFVDISQVNSRNFHEIHWVNMRWLVEQVKLHPRPANNTKIYGGGHSMWGSGGNRDGVQRFWRDLIGGCASARFHRPPSGNGLNERAVASLKAVRELEKHAKLWDMTPQMELLRDRYDEVYVAGRPGTAYVLYFAEGGEVGLDLTSDDGSYTVHWISIATGHPQAEATVKSGQVVKLVAPDTEGWIAILRA